MTVAELIDRLQKLPPYLPILCDVGHRHDESIDGVTTCNIGNHVGPVAVIKTIDDKRNEDDAGAHW